MTQKTKTKKVPVCIGIIMDGNRRWARAHGLLTLEGHKVGYERFKDFIKWAGDRGVNNLIFYAFSTENWKRSEKEKNYLFKLIEKAFKNDLEEIKNRNIRIKFAGQLDRFSQNLQKVLSDAEKQTAHNTGGTVMIAFSYGGRSEILHAVNELITEGSKKPVTEEEFKERLWTKDIPDPDLIIRTGGAMRLSNFLPWQSVYSELYFTNTYWPDFDRKEFEYILEEYNSRERRMGK